MGIINHHDDFNTLKLLAKNCEYCTNYEECNIKSPCYAFSLKIKNGAVKNYKTKKYIQVFEPNDMQKDVFRLAKDLAKGVNVAVDELANKFFQAKTKP